MNARHILSVGAVAIICQTSFAQSPDIDKERMKNEIWQLENTNRRLQMDTDDAVTKQRREQELEKKSKAAAIEAARPKSARELDEMARLSAGISPADWEKRKPQNDPFRNGTFRPQTSAPVSAAPVAAVARPTPPMPLAAPLDPVFEAASNQSAAIAVLVYPDSKTEGTALRTRIIEIADRLEREKSQLIESPNAPFLIARMAARELGIAPVR